MRLLLTLALLTFAPRPAAAQPTVATPPAPASAVVESESRSVGAADRGRLESPASLTEGPGLSLRAGPGGLFGTAELVGLIARSAARVAEEEPGPRLLVGHLSTRSGGHFSPHQSHQSGRDVDLGYYVTDEDGTPIEPATFAELGSFACGRTQDGAVCIDGHRTFMLIAAMVRDPIARVQWILMAAEIREHVLAAGRRTQVDEATLDLVRTVTEPRQGSEAHRDHMHVRIYCPVDDRPRCRDRGPYHALYEGTPPPSARR